MEGLHERDHHFLLWGHRSVSKLSAMDQQNWLAGIKISEPYDASVGREIAGMWALMENWFLLDPG